MKKYWPQLQLIGLWVVAISLAIIAAKQVMDIYATYKDKERDKATLFQIPPSMSEPQTKIDPAMRTKIQYLDSLHDFGTLTDGDSASFGYRFKNVGDKPLTINMAFGSCGCTVPYWSKKPIPVGGEGVIRVVFNSKGKVGFQAKNVTVVANTVPERTIVRFRVNVIPRPKN